MEKPPAPFREEPAARRTRRVGIALLLLASFLPYHGCIAHPREFEPPPAGGITSANNGYDRSYEPYVPAGRIEWILRNTLLHEELRSDEGGTLLGDAGTSDDYGYLVFFGIVPWLLLLGLAMRRGSGAHRVAAWLALAGSVALPPALLWAMRKENVGIGDAPFPAIEAWCAAAAAVLVLAWRPPGRRRPGDLEATLSTHAAVGLGIVLFRPFLNYVAWVHLQGHAPAAVALAFLHNYRPGFWVTLLGLSMIAAPLYFSGPHLLPRYDLHLPWPSPSSTPTPTSTSTGSTRTGTRSSTGPEPPDSSPS